MDSKIEGMRALASSVAVLGRRPWQFYKDDQGFASPLPSTPSASIVSPGVYRTLNGDPLNFPDKSITGLHVADAILAAGAFR